MGVVPLLAASMGAVATYSSSDAPKEQIVVTGEAAKAAKDGKLTIEIVRRNENQDEAIAWPLVFLAPGILLGFAALIWASNR